MSQDEDGKPTIQCAKNGPYLVRNASRLVGIADGKAYETQQVTALCRCGGSANKPYCDGTHSRNGFSDEKLEGRTPDRRESYEGAGISVHDNRGICAHAGFCTTALPSVFRVSEEPFVDANGASNEEIVAAINKCPSGALSYSVDGVEHSERGGESTILIAPNGPYAIKGGAVLEGIASGEGATSDHFDLCRCGASKNKPFCDGSHWNCQFDEHA